MNKAMITRLAWQSAGLEKQAQGWVSAIGSGLANAARGAGRAGKWTAMLAPRTLHRAGQIGRGMGGANPVGQALGYAGGVAAVPAGLGAIHGAANWISPDNPARYAESRGYLNKANENIAAFKEGGRDPTQSSLGRFFGGDYGYSKAQRAAKASEMQKQLAAGTFDDRNVFHKMWAAGGYNPLGLGTGQSSGYHKNQLNEAAKQINENPTQGGGIKGLGSSWNPAGWWAGGNRGLLGGYGSLPEAQEEHARLLGGKEHGGWTTDNPTVTNWGGAQPGGGLASMGGTNYPMPLGLPPGLLSPDMISQYYRPEGMSSANTATPGILSGSDFGSRRG